MIRVMPKPRIGPEPNAAIAMPPNSAVTLASAMVPLALMMVLIGALRGAGDTRWPLALNLIGIVFLRVPLAVYLAHDEIAIPFVMTIQGLGWGVVGAWYAAIADIVVRCGLLMARFQHEGWSRIDV